jgi:MFS transporter, DHA1 family, multidrug resistance protein
VHRIRLIGLLHTFVGRRTSSLRRLVSSFSFLNPDAQQLWKRPQWLLAVMLACLGMLGPFSIDTYLPAFSGIAASLSATPVQMQQTLSGYLFGFAVMNLFHGALADSFGRKPVILWGIGVFTLASVGCALSETIGALVFFRTLQGISSGAGVVVSRAIIRDMYEPANAQRVMSQVTIYFGVAPAIAPIIGGVLFEYVGWHSIFWFLAVAGFVLWAANAAWLPESLHVSQRQSFEVRNLLSGYWGFVKNPNFMALVLASGIPFNGMFLYVLAAPTFLGEHLQLAPTQFFWFFVFSIGGIMGGAWWSGRLAGKVRPKDQIRRGVLTMAVIAIVNALANEVFVAHAWWALLPIAIFAFGWALMVPVVTLLVLDLAPERRGMASSLQAAVGSLSNGIVAGAIVPLVMHSTRALAWTSLAMLMIGVVAWMWVKPRLPAAARL